MELVEQARPLPDEELLLFFVAKWQEWVVVARLFDKLLAYLNRTWVKTQRSSSTSADVLDVGLTAEVIWRDHMLVGGLKERLGDAMLRLIRDDRNGVQIQGASFFLHNLGPHLLTNVCLFFAPAASHRPSRPQLPPLLWFVDLLLSLFPRIHHRCRSHPTHGDWL